MDSIVVAGGDLDSLDRRMKEEILRQPRLADDIAPSNKWFQGIQFKSIKEGLKVENLSPQSFWYKAGLRPKDELFAVNNVTLGTVSDFRSIVRRGMMCPGYLVLSIRRSDAKPVHLLVSELE
jgi:S1-C subfamily serine protease